jgi:CBS domain-containing protein
MPQVKQVMTRQVEVISPDSSLQEAARKMKSLDVGPLPVCEADKVVGMITDRDITIRAVAEGKDPKTARVRDAMTPSVEFCYEDQDVQEAARLMKEKQIRRLAVYSRDNRLVGILSLGDVAVQTGDERLAGDVVERVSQPS